MTKVLISCFLIFFTSSYIIAQGDVVIENFENSWEQDFSKAKALAKKANKPILVFFTGSDWCGPCKMLDADIFKSEEFKKLSDSEFILYEADFPRNTNLITNSQQNDNVFLKEKYGVNSYPTIVIINEKGKEMGRLKGYNLMRDTSYHYSFFEETLKKIK
jgi:thioredoxin-related protein